MNSIAAIKTRASALDLGNSIFVGLSLAAAVIAGWWLAPQYGVHVLLWLAIAVVAIVVIASPVVGVALLVATIPMENMFVLGDQVTWVRAIGLVVFAAWVLRKLMRRESWAPILSANYLKPAVLFVLLAFASLLWVERFSLAIGPLLTTGQLLAMSLLVVGVVDSWQRLEWVVRLVVLSGLVTSVLTVSQSWSGEVGRAGHGLGGGVNQTAAVLVLLLPFGFYLLRTSRSRLWRLVGVVFVAVGPLAVILTFSRTSFIFLAVILGLQLWDMLKDSNTDRVLMTVVGLIVGVVLFVSVPWDRVLERGSTITPAIQGVRGSDDELESGRVHFWLAAVAMFNDYPLLGVGYGNFRNQFLDYQFAVPSKWVVHYTTTLKSPHSSFFGILAELGLVGTALWYLLFGVAFLDIKKGWTSDSRVHTRSHKVLVRAVFYSLLVATMYGFVVVMHTEKLLWVLLGLTAVLRRLTSHSDERASSRVVSNQG